MRSFVFVLVALVSSSALGAGDPRFYEFVIPAGASGMQYWTGSFWAAMPTIGGKGVFEDEDGAVESLRVRAVGVPYTDMTLGVAGDALALGGAETVTYQMGALGMGPGGPQRSVTASAVGQAPSVAMKVVARGVGRILGVEDFQVMTGAFLDRIGGFYGVLFAACLAVMVAGVVFGYVERFMGMGTGMTARERADVDANEKFYSNSREFAEAKRDVDDVLGKDFKDF